MRIFVTCIVIALLWIADAKADCSGQSQAAASCGGGGVARIRPVRKVIGILARIARPRARACGGSTTITTATIAVPSVMAPLNPNAGSLAQQSANYRAANGIQGHSYFEYGHLTGVGYSSNNPNPLTCLNYMGGDYKVARGRDGYYATRIIQ